ncbi:MAG: DNA translocase FtsK 4TM domain-containing protein [Patescibacteria group bacterium]|nr:DNA translocase FtsK 4TM domain-containing protein [Patescibacteria group bacterium]
MARKRRKFGSLRDLDLGSPKLEMSPQTKRGIMIVALITFGVLSLLSLFDLAGTLGVYVNGFLKITFGVNRWFLPFLLILIGYFLLRPAKYDYHFSNTLGFIILVLGYNALVNIIFHSADVIAAAGLGEGGGYVGVILAWPFLKFMGFWASLVVSLAIAVIGFMLLFEVSLHSLLEKKEWFSQYWNGLNDSMASRRVKKIQAERERQYETGDEEDEQEDADDEDEKMVKPIFSQKPVEVEQAGGGYKLPEPTEEEQEAKQLDMGVTKFKRTKIDLPLDLLDGKTTVPKGGDLRANKLIIEKTLQNFGINVEMGDAQVGPTVTQYTLKPAEGVKLSRITGLGDNLALALAAHPIRVEAPIPGRSLVGIEVPNQATAIVPLKEILDSDSFRTRSSSLSIALGKDVMGKPWLSPLDKMPHLLIAGSTGSGKSVCINSVILSLLFQNGPGDLKFIMVDPKRVELPMYNGIPHLLTPVITDVKKTINALRWSIREMERRFDVLSAARHRNIASYNAETEDKMSYIVIIIDELADLMASAGPEVEAAIVRLAQMSRAVGIHLVLATQRPSVDVITGLIKANITCRIAFSVASLIDSRTILDMSGAEKLLGRGDMLFISAEISKPKRLQGAFSSDDEIKKVIDYLKDRAEPEYIEEVVEKQQITGFGDSHTGVDDGDSDALLPEAKDVIIRAGKASASLLQRRLRIGYARAARILDLLEAQGIIGPGDGAKPRDVLINQLSSDIISDTNEGELDSDSPDDEVDEDENETFQ